MTTNSVCVAIFRENEVLFVKHKPSSKHTTGYYGLPGGYVEYPESYKSAATREVEEETGLEIDESDLLEVGTYPIRVEKKIGEVKTSIVLYSCKRFRGKIRDGLETVPIWVEILDVLSGKYKIPRISGNFLPDVMKLLKLNYNQK